jgi:hypothetical protein
VPPARRRAPPWRALPPQRPCSESRSPSAGSSGNRPDRVGIRGQRLPPGSSPLLLRLVLLLIHGRRGDGTVELFPTEESEGGGAVDAGGVRRRRRGRSARERVRAEGLAQERVGRETHEVVEMQMTRESPRMRVEKARTAKCRCFCSDCWTVHSSIG